ncbi:magnesium transporter [Alteromonadaceae bacterium BrNp21-10]|nr:magnesium transporter [Alteromonadaceae bacterium BrNp21-10]
MQDSDILLDATIDQLSEAFLTNFPLKSARLLETLSATEGAALLQSQPLFVVVRLWKYLLAGKAEQLFMHLSPPYAVDLICHLDSNVAVGLISRLDSSEQHQILASITQQHPGLAEELSELIVYPDNTAARMMSSQVQAFYADISVAKAVSQLKSLGDKIAEVIYVLDNQQQLVGEVTLGQLIGSSNSTLLATIATPLKTTLNALDHMDTVVEKFEGYRCQALPVLDAQQQLIGQVRFFDVYQSTKEELASDMQTMVGASKDEKALSSSWFAVKKRMPWLQINLLTAFAAAAVVGSFEQLISQVTALAILLPVAAGQSGNAGAQALAVTMRGLTLREISTRHWAKVMFKEMRVGLMNGVAIALTCGIGVFLWSQSFGLALVISLAMVSSLVIAGSSGAIVPIALKKFGLDPAQSSSIVLTTITDIAGFMSFLGIALLLKDMLPVS